MKPVSYCQEQYGPNSDSVRGSKEDTVTGGGYHNYKIRHQNSGRQSNVSQFGQFGGLWTDGTEVWRS